MERIGIHGDVESTVKTLVSNEGRELAGEGGEEQKNNTSTRAARC